MISECFIKWSAFCIHATGVFVFFYFLIASHFLNSIIDWLEHDINDNEICDYIIVGAGSAGLTIASRLMETGSKIVVIEAGGRPPWFSNIPILAPLLHQSPYDWQFKTVPQDDACRALINNQSTWPMGKILGGSSRLNYMAYVDGHPGDYEGWFPDYKNYADKSKDFVAESPRWCSELCDTVLKGIDEITQKGFSSHDSIQKETLEFEKIKVTMVDGERWSTDKLINQKSKYKHNLTIITHAYVEKILFEVNEVKGVEFVKWEKRYKLYANKAVILSAGVIGSPKLLMLSGIGPKEDLERLNIDVISDLPVGKNLMDHISTGIDLITLNSSLSISLPQVLKLQSIIDYFLFHQGPWTSAGIEVVGTLHDNKNDSYSVPEIQFMIVPLGVSQDNGVIFKKAIGIKDEVYQQYFAPLSYKTAITIAPVLLHPKSLGEVKLKSSNPSDNLIIDPKYLSHKDDVSLLIKGIKFIERLINTKPMKALGASLYNKPFPGCENTIFGSSDYWECYIRHLTLTSYHPAGTCKMESVVDNSFRVLSTKKLFVIDASVLPKLPSGNINAAIMMIAEKATSLIIKSELNKKSLLNNIEKSYKQSIVSHIFLSYKNDQNICKKARWS